MDDSVVKIRVKTVADSNSTQGVDEVNKKIVNNTDKINQEQVKQVAKTNDEIEKLVKEREKIFEKYLNDQKNKIMDWDYSYEKNRYQELFDKYQSGKSIPSMGVYRKVDTDELRFWDTDSKKWLEIPQLYRVELEKAQEVQEQVKQVEQQITAEDEKQVELQHEQNSAVQETINGSNKLRDNVVKLDEQSTKIIKKSSILGNAFAYVLGRLAYRAGRNLRNLVDSIIKQAIQGSQMLVDKVATIKAFLGSVAQTIMPYIQSAVEWVLNVIVDAIRNLQWFIFKLSGVDILQHSSSVFEKNMSKAQKSTSKMMKDLMGFDEVAKLSEKMSSSDEEGFTPHFLGDLGQMKTDQEVPGWLKWIYDNREALITVAEIVGGLFAVGKIAEWGANIASFIKGPLGLLGTTLGNLALIAGGIVITALCAKQVWDDIQTLKQELGEISKHVEEHYDTILEQNSDYDQMLDDQQTRIKGQNDLLAETEIWWRNILGLNDSNLEIAEKNAIASGKIYDYMVDQYNEGKLTNKQKERTLGLMSGQVKTNEELIEKLQKEGKDTSDLEEANKKLRTQVWAIANGVEWSSDMTSQWAQENDKVRTGYDGTVEVLEGINDIKIEDKNASVNINTSNAMTSLGNVFQKIGEILGLLSSNDIFGTSSFSLSKAMSTAFNWGSRIRARFGFDGGGIILPQPGHGVPINAVMSERRAEAIIPLENPEAMETLGQAIGKYVNIAIDNVMKVDGRVLATATNNTTSMNNFLRNR